MLPQDILKQIRRIQITTRRMVTDVFAGQYQSVFKGRGMEFCEIREYCPGDEIRFIDWNVTARMNHPYVKKFIEERQLTVMLVLDMSRSSFFGTVNKLKQQFAAEVCAVLASLAIRNNDKVGFMAFSDRIEKFIPPRKGLRHVLRVIREALYAKPEGRLTDINLAIEYLNRLTKRRCIAFIISDFYADGFKKMLAVANRRHDIVAVTITDPREISLPDVGIIRLDDAESGESFLLDTSDASLRRQYEDNSRRLMRQRSELFSSISVDNVDIRTDVPYSRTLIKFFASRARKRRFRR